MVGGRMESTKMITFVPLIFCSSTFSIYKKSFSVALLQQSDRVISFGSYRMYA